MPATSKQTNLLATSENKTVTEALQPVLIDLKALSLITKQLHWNVRGPHFREVHLQLDELYAILEEGADEVAERLATLGVSPSAQAAEVAKDTKVQPVPTGFLKDTEVLELIVDRLTVGIANIREHMEATEDPDPVTADLLHEVVSGLEKQQWMLRSHLL